MATIIACWRRRSVSAIEVRGSLSVFVLRRRTFRVSAVSASVTVAVVTNCTSLCFIVRLKWGSEQTTGVVRCTSIETWKSVRTLREKWGLDLGWFEGAL